MIHEEIEGRRLVLRSEIALTRSELRTGLRDLSGGIAVGRLALTALRLASPRFRWMSLVPPAIAAIAAFRSTRPS